MCCIPFSCETDKKKNSSRTARTPIKFAECHKNIHPIEFGSSFYILFRFYSDAFHPKASIHALISFICAKLYIDGVVVVVVPFLFDLVFDVVQIVSVPFHCFGKTHWGDFAEAHRHFQIIYTFHLGGLYCLKLNIFVWICVFECACAPHCRIMANYHLNLISTFVHDGSH